MKDRRSVFLYRHTPLCPAYIVHNRIFQGGGNMEGSMLLSEVPLGQSCQVVESRLLRLLDLGFCEESQVVPLYTCPWGGTRLYHVKQTRIALRDSDAAQIQVKAVE